MFEAVIENKDTKSNDKNAPVSIKIAALMVAFSSGALFLLAELILSVVSFVNHTSYRGWDVILLVAAFALFGLGAHFLDLIEKEKKAKKIDYCKKHGLIGDKRDKAFDK
jgi:hypothetical protein